MIIAGHKERGAMKKKMFRKEHHSKARDFFNMGVWAKI